MLKHPFADIEDTDVRADVELHVVGQAERVYQLDQGWHRKGETRQVRLSARVDHERVHHAARLQPYAGRGTARLEGIRHRNAKRWVTKLSTSGCFLGVRYFPNQGRAGREIPLPLPPPIITGSIFRIFRG